MTKQKSTKRALLMSALALVMCVSMLIGSTFAWFTDSVTSGNNKIVAGTLDIDLYKVELKDNWVEELSAGNDIFNNVEITDSEEPIFSENILWEPGYTEVANLKLVNNGTLALKYQAIIRPTSTIGMLAEVIDVYVANEVITSMGGSREDQIKNNMEYVGTLKEIMEGTAIINGEMKTAGDTQFFSIVLKMQESAGNKYQGQTAGAFDITVLATQLTHESDSFNNQYDAGAADELNKQYIKVNVTYNPEWLANGLDATNRKVAADAALDQEFISLKAAQDAIDALYTGSGNYNGTGAFYCSAGAESINHNPISAIEYVVYGANSLGGDVRLGKWGDNNFARIPDVKVVAGNPTAALIGTGAESISAHVAGGYEAGFVDAGTLTVKGITFDGIKSIYADGSSNVSGRNATSAYTVIEDCSFTNQLYVYIEDSTPHELGYKLIDCDFTATATTGYAFVIQDGANSIDKLVIDGCTFTGYGRGLQIQIEGADVQITNNTIVSTNQEADRCAIQFTDGKSFVVTGNTINVNGGNAFKFHDAATNRDVTYTISSNNITAPYLANDDTSFGLNGKITSSGNTLNISNPGKCIEDDGTVSISVTIN